MRKIITLILTLAMLFTTGITAACDSKNTVSIAICNDESNAVRALQLLYDKGVIKELPVENEKLTFEGSSWTSSNDVKITLISENLLVASMLDYDFVCLPSNTALTGRVDQSKLVAREDDPELVSAKANVLAAREGDYAGNSSYKAKIDALTNALLSSEVSEYVAQKFGGAVTCDSSSQIDLRSSAASSVNGNGAKISVCASELPHADILKNCVAQILSAQGYTLEVQVIDWTMQNDGVANGDYDANYFQHIPYLETYSGSVSLFAACKVHYEPLGIYRGKSTGDLPK